MLLVLLKVVILSPCLQIMEGVFFSKIFNFDLQKNRKKKFKKNLKKPYGANFSTKSDQSSQSYLLPFQSPQNPNF